MRYSLFILILISCFACNRKHSDLAFKISSIKEAEQKIKEFKSNYRFNEVEEYTQTVKTQFPDSIFSLILQADWAYFTMNYQEAERLCSEALEMDSINVDALNCKALIALDLNHIDASLKYVRKAIEIDSNHIVSWINYANVLNKNRDINSFLNAINKALKIDSTNSEALCEMGGYLSRYGNDINESAKYLNRALESNPLNYAAHHLLGRGYSPAEYSSVMITTEKSLLEVDSLLMHNQFEKADLLMKMEYDEVTLDIDMLILKAATEFHMKNYRACINHAFSILDRKPNYGIAHYFIAESLRKLKDEHNILIQEFKYDFSKKETPNEFPFLRKVFINFHLCDEILQKNILINTEPFKGFMEAIYISGSTVYFMDFHHLLWNCPHLENTRGTRTVGMRLSDDLKGQGGHHTTSNKIQQIENTFGKYNVAFHEFGHLIHWLFTPKQTLDLKSLYIKAKRGNYTLDWYADLNEREYFAQGIEAYLSTQKRPGLPAAFINTREDLIDKDIDLYHFIESLINQPSYIDNIVQAYIVKSNYLNIEAAISLLDSASGLFPQNHSLPIEIGNLYREDHNYQKATEIHSKIIEQDPQNVYAQYELSNDLFEKKKEVKEAVKILEMVKDHEEINAEMLSQLGYYYLLGGEHQKAIEVLEKAIELDPYPDPYNFRRKDSYHILAKAQINEVDYISAEQNIQKSLQANSNNAGAYADMAFILFSTNRRNEAEEFILKAIKIDCENEDVINIKKLIKIK
ncbi:MULTISPECIES: tetratricopeptide repeat protein [unclassified Lentimicrobium]|uniref:tetratricopeptide repeat protein n=1 Tax=unclassified Lentimicrobium TaxID=2677434 RepID=UPI00155328E7|nr:MULTISPECIES: tetratricopeptide repeat protein [unclassified Lentimicrobium]NPD47348.1 tetratricopeptide repeat protein [Lentimicrobium sp. S6]NPD85444.1 tetratricopeptide repeat protein [Lentimicrobium sp. L6]